MHKTLTRYAAKKDIQAATHWYNGQQKGLGKRFTTDVRKQTRLIAQTPFAYGIRYESVRVANLKIFLL